MFESIGHLYYLINDVDLRNNDIVDMFRNASKYNFDSIITETHMEDSKIYLHFEQAGKMVEPKTSENKKTVPTTCTNRCSTRISSGCT